MQRNDSPSRWVVSASTSPGLKDWITVLLDGSVSEAKILDFLDMSYDLIDGAGRKENK